ncbi:hypothetical protein GGR51DRAFT_565725 [Nemania sp. FL0031]|nr:hypothetical protein GGR51DRAFT_565725 [Nemania sp. FL0031]
MPAAKIEEVLATKPVTFNIKTSGGAWKCQIHSNRAAYERVRATQTEPIPGITRSDSSLSTTSTASTSSSKSSY